MTMANTTNRNEWNSAAGQTAFSYTFRIDRKEDLRVFVNGAETTAFTVDTLGNESGGTATLTTPAGLDDLVVLLRNTVETQNTQYPERGPFPTAATEWTLDKLTQIVQDHTEQMNRAPAYVPGSPTGGVVFPEPVAGGFVQYSDMLELVAAPLVIQVFLTPGQTLVEQGTLANGANSEVKAYVGLPAVYQVTVSGNWFFMPWIELNPDPTTGFTIYYSSPAPALPRVPTRTIKITGAP